MLTGDDTPAPTGEADPGQGEPSEAPAGLPDTPSPDSGLTALQERYDNLHSRFGSQGQELGSLRQKLSSYETELADHRSWRERQDRAKGMDKYEVEARLNKFLQDPDGYIESRLADKLTPLQKEQEELRRWREGQREQSVVGMVESFKREFPDSVKYADEINARLQRIPREHLTREMLEDAYIAAETRAGKKAEESAKKKLAAMTRSAALPKGVASPNGNQPAGKAKTFDQAVTRAKARIASGG